MTINFGNLGYHVKDKVKKKISADFFRFASGAVRFQLSPFLEKEYWTLSLGCCVNRHNTSQVNKWAAEVVS